ncbi:hypothetical protein IAQ67_14750 [Paenibacillus peoriae]|uniref:Uncharacterized protein n=1 Tax=Paenibacillus peoriae TaxID=59893 RepID=A0A7H0Y265_9BACL|nr:hypothetical protein [Paenibacillus peoriae]QNR65173.1 hypothetical protein IAQ67_14750 [Paenibacillus peoriae]
MIQQLTIDTFLNTKVPIKRLVERWLMLDFLDRLKGSSAFMEYKDVCMSFRVPFRIGELHFSLFNDKRQEGDFAKLVQIRDKESVLKIKHHLTGIIETEEGYRALYAKTEYPHNTNHIVTQGLNGTAQFQIGDYWKVRATSMPPMTENATIRTVIREMTGKAVHFILKTPDDWLQEITTLPVYLEHISWKGSTLSIKGSQGTYLHITGVTRVRVSERYLLFDVYNSPHGYSYSFYMASSIDLYKK